MKKRGYHDFSFKIFVAHLSTTLTESMKQLLEKNAHYETIQWKLCSEDVHFQLNSFDWIWILRKYS